MAKGGTPKIGADIALDGEQQFKRAVSEIGNNLRTMSAELKAVSARYGENASSVKALASTSDVLHRKMDEQRDKVKVLGDALQNAANRFGDVDARTIKWQASLYTAQAELYKTDAELSENMRQLAAIGEQYDVTAEQILTLAQNNQYLEKQVSTQKNTIRGLEEGVRKWTEAAGSADDRTQQWQHALDDAKQELKGLERDLSTTNQEFDNMQKNLDATQKGMDASTEKAGGLGSAIQGIAGAFGIEFNNGITKALKGLDQFNASTLLAVGAATGFIGSLANATFSTAEYVKEVEEMAATTGFTAEAVQKLEYVSSATGVSIDTVKTSMAGLTRSLSSASKGNEELQKSFRRIGVSTKEFERGMIDAEDVLLKVIDGLAKIPNETQRNAKAMEFLGRNASELGPLFQIGSDGIKALMQDADDLGMVIDAQTREKFNELSKAMSRFNATTTTVKNTLAQALLPVIQIIADLISAIPPEVLAVITVIAGVIAMVVAVVKVIADVKSAFGDAGKAMDGMNMKMLATIGVVAALVALLVALAVAIAVIAGKSDELGNAFSKAQSMVNTSQKPSTGRNARGTDNWRGGWSWVGEEGPELINLPRGSRILSYQQSMAAATNNGAGSRGGDTYYVTMPLTDIEEIPEAIRIMKTTPQRRRSGQRRER